MRPAFAIIAKSTSKDSLVSSCGRVASFALIRLGLVVLMGGMLALSGPAEAAKKAKPAEKQDLVLPSNPLLLMDVQSGKVLYHQKANQKWYPASLTKLMTAYVTFRALAAGELSEDSVVTISAHALAYPASKMGFKVGTRLTVDNALKMVLVKSANDIAAALGERVAGSEPAFAARMNKEAARLGMTATHFVNANGLFHPDQTTSARDMAVLARQILLEFPHYRPLFRIPAIRHGKRVLRSYNKLLETFRGANGMKTGFVCASGYNLVSSATRNGRQLVAVVLGAPNTQVRSETAAFLLTQGFVRQDMAPGAGSSIADEAQFGAITRPRDMRAEICPGGRPKWNGHVEYKVSFLDPRFKLMEPVRVYTGVKEKQIVLPQMMAQLPLASPFEKPVLPLKAQKGDVVRLADLPRPKP
nr:D-alanyl-D-alanine carboxypeptidase family protein [uncultured Cohaesibacter sp.]